MNPLISLFFHLLQCEDFFFNPFSKWPLSTLSLIHMFQRLYASRAQRLPIAVPQSRSASSTRSNASKRAVQHSVRPDHQQQWRQLMRAEMTGLTFEVCSEIEMLAIATMTDLWESEQRPVLSTAATTTATMMTISPQSKTCCILR
jgi:hypothetical protein